ncbi:hypothetical protein GGR56DRAFT_644399 [Xylariaceae sp. FL0804]|nr:hypothetical protein GGR56DRAFT_644399 [Xylariaceae sp. FL0804]
MIWNEMSHTAQSGTLRIFSEASRATLNVTRMAAISIAHLSMQSRLSTSVRQSCRRGSAAGSVEQALRPAAPKPGALTRTHGRDGPRPRIRTSRSTRWCAVTAGSRSTSSGRRGWRRSSVTDQVRYDLEWAQPYVFFSSLERLGVAISRPPALEMKSVLMLKMAQLKVQTLVDMKFSFVMFHDRGMFGTAILQAQDLMRERPCLCRVSGRGVVLPNSVISDVLELAPDERVETKLAILSCPGGWADGRTVTSAVIAAEGPFPRAFACSNCQAHEAHRAPPARS